MQLLTRSSVSLLGALVLALGLTACDNFEDNLDFEPGDTRTIRGATEVELVPDISFDRDTTVVGNDTTISITNAEIEFGSVMSDYYVQAFTINQDYTWSVEGPNNPTGQTRRDGEFFDVTFNSLGDYTISVSDGTYPGTLEVTVTEPPAIDGCIAQPYDITEGETVEIDAIVASSTDATVSVDYGDGSGIDEDVDLPVEHVYEEPGTYTVEITVENEYGDDTCEFDVEVEEADISISL